ncbi:MAG: dihydroorotate dehydrogenase-like protein [Planctomycetota bacterium]
MDLTTTYCGLTIKSPLIAGASPLSRRVEEACRLEEAGAGAVVMYSLFEEQIAYEQVLLHQVAARACESQPEAMSYLPDAEGFDQGPQGYLDQIRQLKQNLSIPVIASLNGVSDSGWADYARLIENAGADALELNVYEMTFGEHATSRCIEDRIVHLVKHVRRATGLPLAIKLLPYFAGLPSLCDRLLEAGANAAVLFNRTYQPYIDLAELEMSGAYPLSQPNELAPRLRWLGLVSSASPIELACSGGVHHSEDAIRAIMCGASVVQLVSVLLERGVEMLTQMHDDIAFWLEAHGYTGLDELRGSMDHRHCPDPWAYTRSSYIRTLHNYVL